MALDLAKAIRQIKWQIIQASCARSSGQVSKRSHNIEVVVPTRFQIEPESSSALPIWRWTSAAAAAIAQYFFSVKNNRTPEFELASHSI